MIFATIVEKEVTGLPSAKRRPQLAAKRSLRVAASRAERKATNELSAQVNRGEQPIDEDASHSRGADLARHT